MDENSSKRRRRSDSVEQSESVNLRSGPCVQAREASKGGDAASEEASGDSNATHISSLPDEVMQDIFSYLHVRQRMRLGCVCRKWLSLTDSIMTLKDIQCCVTEDMNIAKECSSFTRKFTNFLFVNCAISDDFCEFLEKYGKNVKKLSFDECTLSNPSFELTSEASECLENLEAIEFFDGYLNLFYHLPALQSFFVSQGGEEEARGFLTHREIVRLDKTMPDLKILDINLSQPAFEVDEKSSSNGSEDDDDVELDAKAFIEFVEKRKASLCEFSVIPNDDITATLLTNLCEMKRSKLQTLKVGGNFALMDAEFFINTCKNLSALRNLYFFDPWTLTDDLLSNICNLLPNLQELLISGILDTSIIQVFKLKQLRHLLMSQCIGITPTSFTKALSEFQLHKLRKFHITNVFFENDILVKVFEKMYRLTYLNMSFSSPDSELSDQAVQSICKNLVYLRDLKLVGGKVSDEGLFCADDPEKHITHIKGLRTLQLFNTRVTREAVLKNLEFLELQTLILEPQGEEKNCIEQLRERNPSILEVTL